MLDSALAALASLTDPGMLLMLLIGVISGLVMGLIPGLGGTAAVAILLPVTFGMEPASALALLIGALAVVHTSDTVSAVLLGAPGSASASVTMLDGYAMARKGQAKRALSLAFLSSMAGGIIGAIGLTLAIPLARPLVLSFASPELFMLTVLGVALAAVLSRGNVIKGLTAGLAGLLVGMIGTAPTTAEERFTFGSLFLGDGLSLVAVALGIFGLAEIASRASQRRGDKQSVEVTGGWGSGIREWLGHWSQVLRGGLIGIWAGVLPGVGATAGTWLAYGQAVATAKDKRKFGKGDPRGIVGPESANNSVEAGDLIPTFLFGIPGGVPSAMLLGMLLTYGIQPGPSIINEHLDLLYMIIWAFAIASVLGALFCFLTVRPLSSLTKVPFSILVRRPRGDHAARFLPGWRTARRPVGHAAAGRVRLGLEVHRFPAGALLDRLRAGHPDGTLLLPDRQPLRRLRVDAAPGNHGVHRHPGAADPVECVQVGACPPQAGRG
ncbi:tripartite tricarboxylate transporter permease [Glutamicibacter halophytocola]|uniref:tripartite tricarboxylate transporter permease n=1 Tax=Glutamicibacter halophytocola TaxID=1933880 RepID=UPI00321AB871